MDIIIFSGQSNMQGSTNEPGCSKALNCLEYKFLIDEFVKVQDPVGEDIGDGILLAPANGCGSLVPAFCTAYSKKKGDVIAMHCARGGTAIAEWKVGTTRYNTLIEKCKRGIAKAKENFDIGKIYFVWLQGESDAVCGNSEEYYLSALIELKDNLKKDLEIDKFGIIQVGYFAEYAPWKHDTTKIDDENIMRAQERAAKEDKDFVMLTDICAELSVKNEYLNPKEHGPHYNNRALDIIGEKAGSALAELKN